MTRPLCAGLDPALVYPAYHATHSDREARAGQRGPSHHTEDQRPKGARNALRYAHVQHIDHAIKAIGRTLPEPAPNKSGGAITQELHGPPTAPQP